MADNVTIEGEVERVTFEDHRKGNRIVKMRCDDGKVLGVVGFFPQVLPGSRIRVTGKYETHPQYGDQIQVSTVIDLQPATLAGLKKYLSHLVTGVGPKTAGKVVDFLGETALAALDQSGVPLYVPGVKPDVLVGLKAAWDSMKGKEKKQRGMSEALVFLESHGFSHSMAEKIYKKYGMNTVSAVCSAPYMLADPVSGMDGIGFKTADEFARSLGIGWDSSQRIEAGLHYVSGDMTRQYGHVCLNPGELFRRTRELLELDLDEAGPMEDALKILVEEHKLVQEGEDYFLPYVQQAEMKVAEALVRIDAATSHVPTAEQTTFVPEASLLGQLAEFEAVENLVLSEDQREAVLEATRRDLLVITGGPGVGKTTIIKAVLHLFKKQGLSVCLCAPTGRAAKRMEELTKSEAATIHRTLDFGPVTDDLGAVRGFDFRLEQVEEDVLIVDESSMVDILLAEALLRRVVAGTKVILVGDVDQLPSVGPGAVLRDVIDSEVGKTCRLTRIYRQGESSLISVNAHRVNQGQEPETLPAGVRTDFYRIDRFSAHSARRTILELVTKNIPERFGYRPTDIQVLVPMHKGDCGNEKLNEALQNALNPDTGESLVGSPHDFRVKDRIMQTKNDYERMVFNGEMGRVAKIDTEKDLLTAAFEGPTPDTPRYVDYDREARRQLKLAYATTIHKFQGSEHPVVIVAMLSSHYMMCSRKLLYTGLTRGKKLVVLVTEPRALARALSEERAEHRETRLVERIHKARGSVARVEDLSPRDDLIMPEDLEWPGKKVGT